MEITGRFNNMKYSFEIFMKEQRRAIWLSPKNYTEQELKEKCYDDYLKYCQEHNLISD
jgi:hypothetical protein